MFENCVNETLEPIKKALTSQVQVNRENFPPCAVCGLKIKGIK